MKSKNIHFFSIEAVIGYIIAILGTTLFMAGIYEPLEVKTLDARFKRRTRFFANQEKKGKPIASKGTKSIVLIPLTDRCLKEIEISDNVSEYPLPRKYHGLILDFLTRAGASVIGMDIFFDGRSKNPDQDTLFIRAVENSKNVILPIIFDNKQILEDGRLVSKKQVLHCFEKISNAARAEGFINTKYETVQEDGIFRKIQLINSLENLVYPAFSLAIAGSYLGADLNSLSISSDHIIDSKGIFSIPLYKEKGLKNFMINYLPQKEPFEQIPFSKVLDWSRQGKAGLLKGIAHFKNKAVLIGPALTAEFDFHITPNGKVFGMNIHAQVIRSLIDGDYIKRFNKNHVGITLFTLGLILSFLLANLSSIFSLTLLIIGLGLYCATAFLIFPLTSIMLPLVPVVITFLTIAIFVRFIKLYLDLWRTNITLDRRVEELTTLYDISQSISKTLITDKEKRINLVLDRSLASIGAERGSLMLHDPMTDELVVETVRGEGVGSVQKTRLKPGQGIAGMVFQTNSPLTINKGQKDNRFLGSSSYNSEIKNMLCVPLLVNEKPIGVINLVNKKGNDFFSTEDSNLAMTIAQQTASIIENARLYRLATIDGLTELYVHRHFQIRLEEELRRAHRYSKDLALMITDIDHFKLFNDTYGHQTGDVVLRAVSKIVKDTVRDIDLPARYGGEEFGVILPETDEEGAMILAERLRKNVEELEVETEVHGTLSVNISIGVACFPRIKSEDRKVLIEAADCALYHSKEDGRNRVTMAFPGMEKPQNS